MNIRTQTNEEGIIGLITIFGIGLFALGAVLTVSSGTLAELVKNKNAIAGSESFYTAESAMREGTYQVINDMLETGVGESTNYEGGNLGDEPINYTTENDIIVTPLKWPRWKLEGTASNGNVNRKVIHIIAVSPSGLAFDYAVYAENALIMGGKLKVKGDVFANDGIEFNGNPDINGNVYSSGEVGSGGDITGTITENLDPIPPPTLNDAPYTDRATAEGTYFTDANNAKTFIEDNSPGTMHVFINDTSKTTKLQSVNITGFLYVKGDLQITGGGTFTADENFAVIVVEGALTITGDANITGVVYVSGATSFSGGNVVIKGSLISTGGEINTTLAGSVTIKFNETVFANIENLEGLNKTITEDDPPRILEWREE